MKKKVDKHEVDIFDLLDDYNKKNKHKINTKKKKELLKNPAK